MPVGSPVASFASGSPVAATDILYLARSPFGIGDDRKITAAQLAAYVVLTGAVDPNGVVTGYAGQLYTQVPGDGTAILWININGGTTWK